MSAHRIHLGDSGSLNLQNPPCHLNLSLHICPSSPTKGTSILIQSAAMSKHSNQRMSATWGSKAPAERDLPVMRHQHEQ